MERSRRVAVTSPQTRLAHARGRARGRWRVARLDAGDAERAEVHYRRQRTQAGLALVGVALVVPGLPLLLWARPDLDALLLFGIPVSWLALGVLPYPAMAAIGFWQLYRSERIEGAPPAADPADAPASGAPETAHHRLRIAVRVRRRPAGPAPHAASPAYPHEYSGGDRSPEEAAPSAAAAGPAPQSAEGESPADDAERDGTRHTGLEDGPPAADGASSRTAPPAAAQDHSERGAEPDSDADSASGPGGSGPSEGPRQPGVPPTGPEVHGGPDGGGAETLPRTGPAAGGNGAGEERRGGSSGGPCRGGAGRQGER